MEQTALITGASSGLGAETAQVFLKNGYQVFGTSRNRENGEKSDGITWIKLDLANPESVESAANWIKSELFQLSVVIHNAGIGSLGSALDFGWADYEKVFKTNFFGVVHLNNCLQKYLLQQKPRIIFISSLAGEFGLNYRAAYVSSKHAMEGYVKSMRMELKGEGLHVSLLAPGDVHTGISKSRLIVEPNPDSPLKLPYHRVAKKIDLEVDEGISPTRVAQRIYSISQKRKPRFKYIEAKPIQKLSNFIYHVLPYEWFETLIINHYNQK